MGVLRDIFLGTWQVTLPQDEYDHAVANGIGGRLDPPRRGRAAGEPWNLCAQCGPLAVEADGLWGAPYQKKCDEIAAIQSQHRAARGCGARNCYAART